MSLDIPDSFEFTIGLDLDVGITSIPKINIGLDPININLAPVDIRTRADRDQADRHVVPDQGNSLGPGLVPARLQSLLRPARSRGRQRAALRAGTGHHRALCSQSVRMPPTGPGRLRPWPPGRGAGRAGGQSGLGDGRAQAAAALPGRPRRLSLSSAALAGHDAGEILLPDGLAARCGGDSRLLPIRHRRCRDPEMHLRLGETTPPAATTRSCGWPERLSRSSSMSPRRRVSAPSRRGRSSSPGPARMRRRRSSS